MVLGIRLDRRRSDRPDNQNASTQGWSWLSTRTKAWISVGNRPGSSAKRPRNRWRSVPTGRWPPAGCCGSPQGTNRPARRPGASSPCRHPVDGPFKYRITRLDPIAALPRRECNMHVYCGTKLDASRSASKISSLVISDFSSAIGREVPMGSLVLAAIRNHLSASLTFL